MDLEKGGGVATAAAAMEEMGSDQGESVEVLKGMMKSWMNDDDYDQVMLTEKAQLQKLALLLRNNEEPLMERVVKSEQERVQYLKTVNDSYDETMKLLDDSTALRERRFSGMVGGSARSLVARDVHDYVVYGLNMCMQNVRNSCLRVDNLRKLRTHYDALADAIADPAADVPSLVAEASEYRASMWEYCHNHRTASARANSSAYSKALMLEGVGFPELVRRHQLKLSFGGGDFGDLKETQKLEVYNSIIVESGRAQVPVRLLSGSGGRKVGAASTLEEAVRVFIMAAGILVWDVFTKEQNVEAILSSSLKVMAEVGAFAVEAAVTAVTNAVANVDLGVFTCSVAGFVVGAIAGLIFVTVSGLLIDAIFGSPNKVPPIAELKFHTAVMPDGMSLAYAIAHD